MSTQKRVQKAQVTTVGDNNKPLAKFDVWSERGKPGYFVGKKVAVGKFIELKHVDSTRETRQFIKENNEHLVSLLKEKRHIKSARRSINNPRIGKDHRK
jgi:hypothetical protein